MVGYASVFVKNTLGESNLQFSLQTSGEDKLGMVFAMKEDTYSGK